MKLVTVNFGSENRWEGMDVMRRYVTLRVDAAVWCPSGRWGPRRVRVTESWATLTAESVYTVLLRDDPARMRPGARGSLTWNPHGSSGPFSAEWEVRPNAVWRFGRVFFRCPKCSRLATRLYVPREDAGAACRRCWGLTYESRQLRTYGMGASCIDVLLAQCGYTAAQFYTVGARERRAVAAAERYAERRKILANRAHPGFRVKWV